GRPLGLHIAGSRRVSSMSATISSMSTPASPTASISSVLPPIREDESACFRRARRSIRGSFHLTGAGRPVVLGAGATEGPPGDQLVEAPRPIRPGWIDLRRGVIAPTTGSAKRVIAALPEGVIAKLPRGDRDEIEAPPDLR